MRERTLAAAQGGYYVATGIWSLVHRRSFEAVAGPKHDYWLVQTVGVLVTGIGAILALAAARERVSPEVRLLAVTSAAGLAAIEVRHAVPGHISRIYLADAAAELAFVGGWLAAGRDMRTR